MPFLYVFLYEFICCHDHHSTPIFPSRTLPTTPSIQETCNLGPHFFFSLLAFFVHDPRNSEHSQLFLPEFPGLPFNTSFERKLNAVQRGTQGIFWRNRTLLANKRKSVECQNNIILHNLSGSVCQAPNHGHCLGAGGSSDICSQTLKKECLACQTHPNHPFHYHCQRYGVSSVQDGQPGGGGRGTLPCSNSLTIA